jgi:hypothetical protein
MEKRPCWECFRSVAGKVTRFGVWRFRPHFNTEGVRCDWSTLKED